MPSVVYKNQQRNQQNQHYSDNGQQDDEPRNLGFRRFSWKVLVKGVKSVAVKENIIQGRVVQSWVKITLG